MQRVAVRAGVHQTTVSLALRNDPRLSAATRQRIQAVARELGYRPNPLVSALIATRRRSNTARRAVIAYVTADDDAHGGSKAVSSYRDLFSGARDRAEELGYGLEHFWLGDPKLTRARFNQITATRNIHGLILGPLFMQHPTLDVDWDRFSVVAYGYAIAEPHVHRVYPDFYHGMVEALRRCRAAGYKRVGTVLEEKTDLKVDHLWLSAYLSEQHLVPGNARIAPLLLSKWDAGAFARWHRRSRPQVVIGLNKILDRVNDWALTPAGRGAADIRLVGLNVSPSMISQGVTGVLIDHKPVGAACVDQVVGMMHRNEKGVPAKALHLIVENGWVDGSRFLPE
jgi:DNA-binding LacI/PurR family transcriptional regulator